MKRVLALAVLIVLAATACSSSSQGPSVPSLASGGGQATGTAAKTSPGRGTSKTAVGRPRVGYSRTRIAQLHAAAQCIREHGVPTYQDPVLTADGHVYTDARSIQDAGAKTTTRAAYDAIQNQIRQACGALFAAAGLQPDDESPAPPQLVQAGVRAARCIRAHGLPNYRDPTSESLFTPGHGFGITPDQLPNNGALGKQDPAVERAFQACRSLLDAEIRASQLSNLAHD